MSLLAKLVGELGSKHTESQPGLREIYMRAHGIHKWRHHSREEYLGPFAAICGKKRAKSPPVSERR